MILLTSCLRFVGCLDNGLRLSVSYLVWSDVKMFDEFVSTGGPVHRSFREVASVDGKANALNKHRLR